MPLDIEKQDTVSQQVRDWIQTTQGWFSYAELDREIKIESRDAKALRRVILHNLVKAGKLERDPQKNGRFRLVVDEAPEMDWREADTSCVLNLQWPFGLEKLVSIYPKNIIIIAGSPNAGKTAFCLDFIARNMHRIELNGLLPIEYFSSEMGAEEMKIRLSKFETSDWAFVARERSENFGDVVKPDRINIIDFLEISDNFFLIAQEIKKIHNKLNKGIALVAIQKNPGAEAGRGGTFSEEKARLVLLMDSGIMKIKKAKNWAGGTNPNGLKWNFNLVQGAKFVNIREV